MIKLYTLITLSFLVLVSGHPVLAQSSTENVPQKKSKIFTRAELGAAFIFNPYGMDGHISYGTTGAATASICVGYSVSKMVRLGVGCQVISTRLENNIQEEVPLPVFASVEFGSRNKKVSPIADINCGYAFILNKGVLEPGYSNGAFFELMPGLSFASKKSTSRFRIAMGTQVQLTRFSSEDSYTLYDASQYIAGDDLGYANVNVRNYNSFIYRMVVKVGVDF